MTELSDFLVNIVASSGDANVLPHSEVTKVLPPRLSYHSLVHMSTKMYTAATSSTFRATFSVFRGTRGVCREAGRGPRTPDNAWGPLLQHTFDSVSSFRFRKLL